VIVLSHFAPTPRLCALAGRTFNEKCNGLLDQVDPPLKDTTVVFGHVHLLFDLTLDGYGFWQIREVTGAFGATVRHAG
jgi:hypothetical protein